MKNVLIVGASGHSKVIIDIIHKTKAYNIVGFIDSYKKKGDTVYGYKILANFSDIDDIILNYDIFGIIMGIGDNHTRKKCKEKISKISSSIKFVPVVHPNAVLANDIIVPDGTVIMAGVVINADAKLGEFCILNTNSSLGHDSIMKDYSSLAPGVTIGGNVKIGYCSAICLKASVINNVTIGKYTVIGAGAVVVSNIGPKSVAYGVPARFIRDRKPGSKYLCNSSIPKQQDSVSSIENLH